MRKLFTKYYKKILATFGVVFILSLNFAIFRFQSYAIFRDYIIVRDQDFTYNNSNPLSILQDLTQNNFLNFLPLYQISTLYYTLLFSIGFIICYLSFKDILNYFSSKFGYNIKGGFSSVFCNITLSILSVYNSFTLERFWMGQDRIILGYFILFPVVLSFIKISDKNYKHTKNDILLVLFITMALAFTNLHTTIFALLVSISFSIFSTNKRLILSLITVCNFSLVILSLVLNYNLNGLSNSLSNISNQDQNLIISAFSPQILSNQNIFMRVLSGAGSWNTPTFFESERLSNQFNWLNYTAIYFNQNINFAFIVFILITLFSVLYIFLRLKNSRNLFFVFLIILIPSILFSFSYSVDFLKGINEFIFKIPGSMVFRESQKLIIPVLIIFISCMAILYSHLSSKYYKAVYLVLLTIFSAGSFIPFSVLSSSLNYFKTPEIIEFALTTCKSRKLAYIPSEIYITPKYSQTFIVNPLTATKNNRCDVLKPQLTKVISKNRQNTIILSNNQGGVKNLDDAFARYMDSIPKSENGILNFDAIKQKQNALNLNMYLQQNKIDLLLVDGFSFEHLFNLKNDLQESYSLIKEEGDLVLFVVK